MGLGHIEDVQRVERETGGIWQIYLEPNQPECNSEFEGGRQTSPIAAERAEVSSRA